MAKKPTEKTTHSIGDVVSRFKKDMGDGIASYGGKLIQDVRIPTGIMPLDLAIGGGFPRGRCHIVYGPESSGKTNICLLAIASHQRMFPEETCVFIDAENSFDPNWARILGVDTDRLVVVKPSFAEQAVDAVEGFMYADDCGMVVVDSLAALVTTQELSSSAEKANVGGNALVVGKLVRKTIQAQVEAEKAGRAPTLMYINQTRLKIGVMFGDPETMPGGNAPRFQANMWLRLYGKSVKDAKVSDTIPVLKDTNFVLKKWKAPIYSATGTFSLVMLPHKGLKPGQTDDFDMIQTYLEEFDQWEKTKTGYKILGEEYATIKAFREKCYNDKAFGDDLREAIIKRVLKDNDMLAEFNGNPKEDVVVTD